MIAKLGYMTHLARSRPAIKRRGLELKNGVYRMKKSLVTTISAAAIASLALLSGTAFASTTNLGTVNPANGQTAFFGGGLGTEAARDFVVFTLVTSDYLQLGAVDTGGSANLSGEKLGLLKYNGGSYQLIATDTFVKSGFWNAGIGENGNGLLLGAGTYKFNIYPPGTDTSQVGYSLSITGVPEISTWAMMLAGFGLLGFAGSRRKTVSLAA
jgi:hypothetical protein